MHTHEASQPVVEVAVKRENTIDCNLHTEVALGKHGRQHQIQMGVDCNRPTQSAPSSWGDALVEEKGAANGRKVAQGADFCGVLIQGKFANSRDLRWIPRMRLHASFPHHYQRIQVMHIVLVLRTTTATEILHNVCGGRRRDENTQVGMHHPSRRTAFCCLQFLGCLREGGGGLVANGESVVILNLPCVSVWCLHLPHKLDEAPGSVAVEGVWMLCACRVCGDKTPLHGAANGVWDVKK